MSTVLSLTGIEQLKGNNITGLNNIKNNKEVPVYITRLKSNIFDNFIFPLINNNWDTINDNLFMIELLEKKIAKYLITDPNNNQLQFYKDLLHIIKSAHAHYSHVSKLYQKHYKSNVKSLGTYIHNLPFIRLKAEYEIYNLIYGVPIKPNIYDPTILKQIKLIFRK